ncbi:MAG: hypothetical protein HZB25_00600 [Candidatus Eisenbacteria bacterium]|nr:hypothetical protein [Candidatus Eisenbacteria bacterium]
MVLKRINVVSAARISGVMGACAGLVVGGVVSVSMIVGTSFSLLSRGTSGFGGEVMTLGVFAVLGLPLMYGILGCIYGLVGSAVYNFLAPRVGGLEVDMEPAPGPIDRSDPSP